MYFLEYASLEKLIFLFINFDKLRTYKWKEKFIIKQNANKIYFGKIFLFNRIKTKWIFIFS